jgi:hypothetical protein
MGAGIAHSADLSNKCESGETNQLHETSCMFAHLVIL